MTNFTDRDATETGAATDLIRDRQHTLKNAIGCSGTGLHSGHKINMTLSPAEPDTGIVFRRSDIAGRGAEIRARWDSVVDTRLCTTIGNKQGVIVGTIEHLLAAFAGFCIDNVVVELDGPEVPIMDGSSAAFAFLIECAGIRQQLAPRRVIEVLRPISVSDRERSAVLVPGRNFSLSVEIDFENQVISRQHFAFDHSPDAFRKELARARTFGLENEVATLRSMGLAKGGSLDNAVVVGQDSVLNEEGLRFDDEFVRHKALDTLGDLYLAGGAIQGHFHGFRSGHEVNNRLLRALFSSQDNWRWVGDDERPVPAIAEPERRKVAANA